MDIRMGWKWPGHLPTRTRIAKPACPVLSPSTARWQQQAQVLEPLSLDSAIPTSLLWAEILPVPPLHLPSTSGCSSTMKRKAVGHLLLLVSQLILTALQHLRPHPLPTERQKIFQDGGSWNSSQFQSRQYRGQRQAWASNGPPAAHST